MASSNQSPDPASALLSLNRNQTVNATVEQTGQPDIANNIGFEGNTGAGVTPGSTQGIGPGSIQALGPNPASPPSGVVSNTQNVSPGAPSGAGLPGVTAGGLLGTGLAGTAATQNYYIAGPGGVAAQTPAPGGGANGPTPTNAYELLSRTS
jgi:hypothetical protein